MTGDRWRAFVAVLLVWHTMRSIPWLIDTLGPTWGVVLSLVNGLLAAAVLAIPVKPPPP
jgi:hypothetical protein